MRQILIALAVLIGYGSLHPFEFVAGDASRDELIAFLTNFDIATTRGDIVGNIFLFAPFGFLAHLATRGSFGGNRKLVAIATIGTLYAIALQVAQMWIPGRVPAIGDAALNAIGILVGIGAASALYGRFPGREYRDRDILIVPLTLAALWVAYRWFPLLPTIDLQNVKNALKPLLVNPEIRPVRIVHDLVAWLTFFRLLAFTPLRNVGAFWMGAGAILIVLAQPFIVGNTISPHTVIGLTLALACLPILRSHNASALVVAGIFVSLLLTGLQPYALSPTPNSFLWLPFSGFLGGSMATNSLNLLHKCFFYGAAVYLLRDCGSRPIASALTVAVWLGLIEFMQIWVVTRTAEITDPVLALFLAWTLHKLGPGTSPTSGNRRTPSSSPRIAPELPGRPR